jgi:cytochrome c peroxidase
MLRFQPGFMDKREDCSARRRSDRAYGQSQFWDGRAAAPELQAVGPMANPIEMGETYPNQVKKLSDSQEYRDLFQKAFGSPEITTNKAGQAIATFERALLSDNSAYDRYKARNKSSRAASQIREKIVKLNLTAQSKKDLVEFEGAKRPIG